MTQDVPYTHLTDQSTAAIKQNDNLPYTQTQAGSSSWGGQGTGAGTLAKGREHPLGTPAFLLSLPSEGQTEVISMLRMGALVLCKIELHLQMVQTKKHC